MYFILVEGFEARKGWIKFKYIAYNSRFVKGCTIDTMVGGGVGMVQNSFYWKGVKFLIVKEGWDIINSNGYDTFAI